MAKLLLTEGFLPDTVIGEVEVFDKNIDRLAALLSSGQFTFSSRFRKEENGDLVLLELSLIPIAALSTMDFRLINQEGAKTFFGVDSIFVDWMSNSFDEDIHIMSLGRELRDLDRSLGHILRIHNNNRKGVKNNLDNVEGAINSVQHHIMSTVIRLAVVALSRGVTEEEVAAEVLKMAETLPAPNKTEFNFPFTHISGEPDESPPETL